MKEEPISTLPTSSFAARPSRSKAVAAFLFWACVFALIYCQAPLYYSNQNQYFLHGLADAGVGFLHDDWLANTKDPTPVFSLLVSATVRFLGPAAFYVYYGLLFGVYCASMVGLFSWLASPVGQVANLPGSMAGWQPAPRELNRLRLVFLALLLAVHSAVARWASYRWVGLDYPWYFQAGVAGQYVLGAMFQPSTFGVLLVLSVCLFARGRPFWAVACACLAASFHSTYALTAGLLTAGYLVALMLEKRSQQAALLGAWALLLIAPTLAYVFVTFGPTSPAKFAEAQEILAHVRLPHHSLPRLWCDEIAAGQIAWCLLGIGLLRGTRLFAALGVAFLLAAALTVLEVATLNNFLALLFPWRISAVLVPIATAVVLSRLVVAAARWLDRLPVAVVSGALIAVLVAAGVAITYYRLGFQSRAAEVPLMDWVKANKAKGDLYLIPVHAPNLEETTRGSQSSDFKPIEAKQADPRLVPPDLQNFRLSTGAPIFVDFKSIPYKDVEVVDWQGRIRLQLWLYAKARAKDTSELPQHGVTHVVFPATGSKAVGGGLTKVYEDSAYRVYRVDATPTPTMPNQ